MLRSQRSTTWLRLTFALFARAVSLFSASSESVSWMPGRLRLLRGVLNHFESRAFPDTSEVEHTGAAM